MPFHTTNRITLRDLVAMADGDLEDTITDRDFLETLAVHCCIIVPPWVMRANPTGGLSRITPVLYNADGQIDRAPILVAMARQLRRLDSFQFGGRLRF